MGVSDEDLIHYIKDYTSYSQLKQTSKYNISQWFQVIETIDLEPLAFAHEDLWYVRMTDGMYHVFVSPMFYAEQVKNGGNVCEIKKVNISVVRKLISDVKFRKNIMYCTNNVNKKL